VGWVAARIPQLDVIGKKNPKMGVITVGLLFTKWGYYWREPIYGGEAGSPILGGLGKIGEKTVGGVRELGHIWTPDQGIPGDSVISPPFGELKRACTNGKC